MKVDLYNQLGEATGKVELSDKIFGLSMNADLVHQVVKAQMANSRQVLAHTKGRGDVRGGGKKPWRQKGTGRARHGSSRSPIWKGGGVTFGPTKERNFKKDINKKMKQKALFMALSSKVRDNQLVVLEDLKLAQSKTKEAVSMLNNVSKVLKNYKLTKAKRDSILAVVSIKDRELERSFGNLPFASVMEARNLNPVDVLKYKYILLTKDSPAAIANNFSAGNSVAAASANPKPAKKTVKKSVK